MAIKGIDVSEHQGSINFSKVASSDVQFVILRDGYGKNTVDKYFMQNARGFQSVKIPVWGVYHFSYALSEKDAENEAVFAVTKVREAGINPKPIIFFDLEYDSVRYAKDNGILIDKAKCCAFTKAFCEKVKSLGYKAGVYFNQDYYANMYTPDILYKYVTWLADYEGSPNYPCDYQQYTNKGSVPGINGNVDMNYSNLKDISTQPVKKTNDVVAEEVIAGKWGNGAERKERLTRAGYNYNDIQTIVNKLVSEPEKSNQEIAEEVIAGKWGNGDDRKKRLTDAGYNYNDIQAIVNKLVGSKPAATPKLAAAQSFSKNLAGTYVVNTLRLNMRYRPGELTPENVIKVLDKGAEVQMYGYFTAIGGKNWYYVQHGSDTGFVSDTYLIKK